MLEVEQVHEKVHPGRLDLTRLVASSRGFTRCLGLLRLDQHQLGRLACARPKSVRHIEQRHRSSCITFLQGEEICCARSQTIQQDHPRLLDNMVVDDGRYHCLVVSVVPPNSDAGNYLRCQN